jgi:hypothetical protein
LKKSLNWWEKEKITHEIFTGTIYAICKFVTDNCVHEGASFYNTDSELGILEEYKKLRNWTAILRLQDYKCLDIFFRINMSWHGR